MFIDIERFENALFESIYISIGGSRRESNIKVVRCIFETLENRRIVTAVNEARLVARTKRRCPQGRVLSPLLWSVVVDDLLVQLNYHGIHVQGYVDDVWIVGIRLFPGSVSEIVQAGLKRVGRWCVQQGMSVNASNTGLMIFTRKRMLGDFRLSRVNNTVLVPVESTDI